jgi:hypothetical protein
VQWSSLGRGQCWYDGNATEELVVLLDADGASISIQNVTIECCRVLESSQVALDGSWASTWLVWSMALVHWRL